MLAGTFSGLLPNEMRISASRREANESAALDHLHARLCRTPMCRERITAIEAIARNEIEYATPLTESPIEADLLPWLIVGAYRSIRVCPLPVVRPDRDWKTLDIYSALLWPQFAISRYRLDFALAVRRHGRPLIVAIECDGARYHNADADAQRDACMEEGGIHTVRATGTEIRNDPLGVVERVDDENARWACLVNS